MQPNEITNTTAYIEKFFKVLTKADVRNQTFLVPMKLYPIQKHWIENRTNRDIIVKPRQVRATTAVLAANSHIVFTTPYQKLAVITHNGELSEFLLLTVHRFYNNLPANMKPECDWSSSSRIRFPSQRKDGKTGLDSFIHIDSAESKSIGFGETLNMAHLSEMCRWPELRAKELFAGISQTVPQGGYITIECYDSETEVMTDEGWKYFSELNDKSLLLTKDRETNKAYYIKPEKIIKEHTRTKMIHFLTEYIDLLVTPNHNIWCAYGTGKSFSFISAEEAKNAWRFTWDTSFIWEGWDKRVFHLPGYLDNYHKKFHPSVNIPMDLFLQYLGYFVSEGWTQNPYCIAIGQSYNSSYFDNMRICCEKIAKHLGKKCHIDRLPQHANFRIEDIRLVSYLSQYTKPKKIPREFMDLSKRQLQILLDSYWEGDGNQERRRCFTTSKELADDIQEILFKLGFRATMRFMNMKKYSGCRKNAWVVSYTDKFTDWRKERYKREDVDYENYVYCAQLPCDNLLLVRRNGKVVWSGNSNPRGRQGLFYELYDAAIRGDINYKPFFYPWWWEPEYVRPVSGKLDYDEEETLLVKVFELTPEQIQFRREKIAELGDLFYQEYAENDKDCFLSSDIGIFDATALRQYMSEVQPGKHEGDLTIWKDVIGGEQYVMGVDTALGIVKGDWQVASVFRVKTNEYVARLRCKMPVDLFAHQVMRLGQRYNDALIGVEKIGFGHTVLQVLIDNRYPNLYYYQAYDSLGEISLSPGWSTDRKSKPIMISDLAAQIRAHDIISWSENLIDELSKLTWEGVERRKIKKSSAHDDEVDAVAIALQIRESAPFAEPSRPRVVSYSKL